MIDVTIAGDEPRILSWRYLEEDSLSYHRYIYFEIETERTKNIYTRKPIVPKIKNLNIRNYLSNLDSSLREVDTNWSTINTN